MKELTKKETELLDKMIEYQNFYEKDENEIQILKVK